MSNQIEVITPVIRTIRGQKVILDSDLARIYDVPTKALNQAVKRNAVRFPPDFMFQLTKEEAEIELRSRSQFVTLKQGMNVKYRPYAFTENGAVMDVLDPPPPPPEPEQPKRRIGFQVEPEEKPANQAKKKTVKGSIYRPMIAAMESKTGACNQDAAIGFIQLNALRQKVAVRMHGKKR